MGFRSLILIVCNIISLFAYGQEVLDRQLFKDSITLSIEQILDTISKKDHVDFSYDASLLSNKTTIYHIDSTFTLNRWLNTLFDNDTTEWIFIENQIIVRIRNKSLPSQIRYHFKGKVLDADSNEPLPFATIAVKGSTLGTVANSNGEFALAYTLDSLKECTLNFSSLGYSAFNLQLSSSDNELVVKLMLNPVELPEAVVVRVDPLSVMKKVCETRGDNYTQNPTLLNGFFRESVVVKEHYLELVEAAIVVNKPSYSNEIASERVMVEKIRRYKDTSLDRDVNIKLQGGPFYFSKLDVARYGDFMPLNDFANEYSYEFEGCVTMNDRINYIISFKPLNDQTSLVYIGRFYIDKKSFAITRVEFQLTDKSIRRSKSVFVHSENKNSKTVPVLAQYEVNYRLSPLGWMLSYAKGELLLNISYKGKWRAEQYKATTELAITSASEGKYQILRNGYMKAKDILSDKATESSSFFWSGYVVIPSLAEVDNLFETK